MEANNMKAIREAVEHIKELARTIYSTSDAGSAHEDLADKIVSLATNALVDASPEVSSIPAVPTKGAKLRSALEIIRRLSKEELVDIKDISDEVRADLISIVGWCDHALAAPMRNCDVGTAEEQAQRFREWCKKHDCPNCQFAKSPCVGNCALGWAQMPYNESEAGK